ncbi:MULTISPECIES: acetyl-CoA carboxylase biotin carboxyl carrier protein [Xanthobacter]|uniref:Biotin carboxyl carrier protein of acetyl-CoA carboxylase n=1 Tax=Xanthobacter aminoxidans TaxID=186280 RepID=A0ABW6ZCE6_9HYPH|nr:MULTISPECIES: acetyl-CoA carboxylase biotin carboxyl carrier protein [Xanthobacter]MCL8383008.1 acetyl-CoA carboxylase biotin carboxyl carrier protein [Xanthobacter aminoxidans]
MKPSNPPIDTAIVKEIADLLSGSDLTEIEVEHEGLRIRVVRAPASVTIAQGAPYAAPYPAGAPVAAVAPAVAAEAPADLSKHPGVVASPMVGTAYLAAEPGAPPFIEVGTSVREGQTVLIVEAMKTMNAIPAPRSGTVTRILVGNAQPVEYGEPLLIIE